MTAISSYGIPHGRAIKKLSSHKAAVNALSFSPDSSKLVSGSADKSIRVWDVAKGKFICQAQTASEVNAVTWVAEGKQIASGGGDYLIRVWYVDIPKGNSWRSKKSKDTKGRSRRWP